MIIQTRGLSDITLGQRTENKIWFYIPFESIIKGQQEFFLFFICLLIALKVIWINNASFFFVMKFGRLMQKTSENNFFFVQVLSRKSGKMILKRVQLNMTWLSSKQDMTSVGLTVVRQLNLLKWATGMCGKLKLLLQVSQISARRIFFFHISKFGEFT